MNIRFQTPQQHPATRFFAGHGVRLVLQFQICQCIARSKKKGVRRISSPEMDQRLPQDFWQWGTPPPLMVYTKTLHVYIYITYIYITYIYIYTYTKTLFFYQIPKIYQICVFHQEKNNIGMVKNPCVVSDKKNGASFCNLKSPVLKLFGWKKIYDSEVFHFEFNNGNFTILDDVPAFHSLVLDQFSIANLLLIGGLEHEF